ncbi:MAG TPA: hypothetical protein VF980_07530 [Thermoanaerobaculia bacterium]
MSAFLEAIVTLLPCDAGGRSAPVSPRDGSYRPFVRSAEGGPLLRVRFIEGPPTLAPGDSDRILLELETSDVGDELLFTGAELELLERESRAVGLVTVARLWRGTLAL